MSRIKAQIEELGLDFKKEIFKLIGIVLALLIISALLYFYSENLFSLLGGVFLSLFVGYLFLTRYQGQLERLKIQRRKELVNLITFFEIYINNNVNVYQSLVNISEFASPYMKEKLNDLLLDIDKDKSVTPFVDFAKNFDSLVIEQLFISIYQLIDEGNNNHSITQFQSLFSKMSEEEHAKNLDDRFKKLDRANVTPVIGAAAITIVMSIGIVNIIGGMLGG